MKLAIYAISKNEEQNVEAFMDSCRGFPVYVLDHSTDNTATMLRNRGALVDTTPIDPFRFDDAKNFAMRLIPIGCDWVLNLDLDERLHENIHEVMNKIDDTTIVRHLYKPDHEIDRLRHECRLHQHLCYEWRLPIHEYLHCMWSREKIQIIDELLITQHPSRERKHTWSHRLLAAVAQYPNEPRMRMLCGRDLYFDGRYEEALENLIAFTKLSSVNAFDLSYVHSLIAKCWAKQGDYGQELWNLEKSAKQSCCERREAYVELAHAYMQRGQYRGCLFNARKAMTIKDGRYAPHNDPGAWSFKPHELMGIAYYNFWNCIKRAISHTEEALRSASGDDAKRISENLTIMREK